MIIDCHAHLMPQSWFHPKSPKSIFDLDGLFKEQDNAGVDMTVFGNNWIRSPDGADALRVVKEFNEHAAELTAMHPKRLLGLACSVPFDDDQILKETERAVKEYNLKGIMINSSVNGEYLDSPRATAFFQLVSDMEAQAGLCPRRGSVAHASGTLRFRLRAQERHELWSLGARRYDPAACKLHRAALSRHGVPPPPGSAMRRRHRRHRSRCLRQRLSAGAHSSQALSRCGASIEDFKRRQTEDPR